MKGYTSVAAPLGEVGQEIYEGISARSSGDIYKTQILSRSVEVEKSYTTTRPVSVLYAMASEREDGDGDLQRSSCAIMAYLTTSIPMARQIEVDVLQQGVHPEHQPRIYTQHEQEDGEGAGPVEVWQHMPPGAFFGSLLKEENFLVDNHPAADQNEKDKFTTYMKQIRKRFEEIRKIESDGLEVARISTDNLPVSLHGIPHIAHYFIQQVPLLIHPEFPFNKEQLHAVSHSHFCKRLHRHFTLLVNKLLEKKRLQDDPMAPEGPKPFSQAWDTQVRLQMDLHAEIKKEITKVEKILNLPCTQTLVTYLYLQIVDKLQSKVEHECGRAVALAHLSENCKDPVQIMHLLEREKTRLTLYKKLQEVHKKIQKWSTPAYPIIRQEHESNVEKYGLPTASAYKLSRHATDEFGILDASSRSVDAMLTAGKLLDETKGQNDTRAAQASGAAAHPNPSVTERVSTSSGSARDDRMLTAGALMRSAREDPLLTIDETRADPHDNDHRVHFGRNPNNITVVPTPGRHAD